MADPNKLCLGCMSELGEGQKFCECCGWNNETSDYKAHQLKPGTILQGKYLVGKVIGEGGFGITYVGWNILLEEKIAIKESYPFGIVSRASTVMATVIPSTGREEYVEKFKNDFLREAKTMSALKRVDGIVEIKDVFTENSTVYIVMEYVEGPTFKEYAKQKGRRLSMDEALELVKPMMVALEQMHKAGLIHRDISPENIKYTPDGKAVLLDFGAARQISEDGQRSLTIELKHGYAPFEQYQTRGRQGPWTDVYALCAMLYKLITGETPPSATDRMSEDIIKKPSELGAKISPDQEAVLLEGLAVAVNNRIQSIAELREKLFKEAESKNDKRETVYLSAKEKMAENSMESLRNAIGVFASLKGFKDSAELIKTCENKITDLKKTESVYKTAKAKLAEGKADSLKKARDLFVSVKEYEDSAELLKKCEEKIAEIDEIESIYKAAKAKMTDGKKDSYENAAELFNSIKGFADSSRQIEICRKKIKEIESREQKGVSLESEKKGNKSVLPIIIISAVAVATIVIAVTSLAASSFFGDIEMNPKGSSVSSSENITSSDVSVKDNVQEEISETEALYIKAVEFYNNENYSEANKIFTAITEYKDSKTYIEAIEKEEKYASALKYYSNGDFEKAKAVFEELEGYKESASYIDEITLEEAYLAAMELYNNGKYGKAADAFSGIADYKDSTEWAEKSIRERDYQNAVYLYNIGSYKDAKKAFSKMNGYKDSEAMIEKCDKKISETAGTGSSGGNTGSSGGNTGSSGGNTGSSGGNTGSSGGNTGSSGGNTGSSGGNTGSSGGNTGSSGGNTDSSGGNTGNSGATISFTCSACGNVVYVQFPAGAASGDYVNGYCGGCGAIIPIRVP